MIIMSGCPVYHTIAPDDYTSVSDTLTFLAGETRLVIPAPTVDDSISEPDEEFVAELSNPTEGATIGDNDTATVLILDNDGKWRFHRIA